MSADKAPTFSYEVRDGLPMIARLARVLGLPWKLQKHVHIKCRQRGATDALAPMTAAFPRTAVICAGIYACVLFVAGICGYEPGETTAERSARQLDTTNRLVCRAYTGEAIDWTDIEDLPPDLRAEVMQALAAGQHNNERKTL